jgi:hypothetical protein
MKRSSKAVGSALVPLVAVSSSPARGGMRHHFNDIVAITPRVGFDNCGAFMASFGVSLFAGQK